jgi:2-dehydropantoate 2-reductase
MKIAVFGAGAIGGYVGGVLAAHGSDVVMIGRAQVQSDIAAHGMTLTDLDGRQDSLAAGRCRYDTDAAALWDADIIIVSVKSGATAEAAAQIAKYARPDALMVSFQNGISNADVLRELGGGRPVLAAMVPWNVAMLGAGRFHRGTQGVLMIEDHSRAIPLQTAFNRAGVDVELRNNMPAILWGKLLLNLNNAINAVSGLPLRAQLANRDYRLCLAACVEEALQIVAAAKIVPAQISHIPPQKIPGLLRLSNFMYKILMRLTLKVDDKARSSMQDDVRSGRMTEVEEINGAVVRLAKRLGRAAPYNQKMLQLVQAANADSAISGEALRRHLYL